MVTGGAASGGRGSFPLPFFENGKKCPNFGEKKCPDCVHFLLKMLFKEYRGEKTHVFVHIQILSLLTLEKVHFDEMY